MNHESCSARISYVFGAEREWRPSQREDVVDARSDEIRREQLRNAGPRVPDHHVRTECDVEREDGAGHLRRDEDRVVVVVVGGPTVLVGGRPQRVVVVVAKTLVVKLQLHGDVRQTGLLLHVNQLDLDVYTVEGASDRLDLPHHVVDEALEKQCILFSFYNFIFFILKNKKLFSFFVFLLFYFIPLSRLLLTRDCPLTRVGMHYKSNQIHLEWGIIIGACNKTCIASIYYILYR